MKTTKEYKDIALYHLSDKWETMIGVTFIATLFGAGITSEEGNLFPSVSINFSDEYSTKFALSIMSIALIIGIVRLIFGGVLSLGLLDINKKVLRNEDINVEQLFSYKNYFMKALGLRLLTLLLEFLWTLLLIIPGIIKTYAYSMAGYIMTENPDIKASEALKLSDDMMKGHKFDLFVLKLSFIGWVLLGGLLFGLGYVVLNPYINVTITAFFNDVYNDYQMGISRNLVTL